MPTEYNINQVYGSICIKGEGCKCQEKGNNYC